MLHANLINNNSMKFADSIGKLASIVNKWSCRRINVFLAAKSFMNSCSTIKKLSSYTSTCHWHYYEFVSMKKCNQLL
uniref:Candidate secreted effector n=1 Tax=Meloidogyne incognita TaxID=6306 RepID=A0A914NKC1_MELIC